MQNTIVYVFKVIMSLIVSGILWVAIIGFPNTDTNSGMFGTETFFKEGLWSVAKEEYVDTYLRVSDNNGKGYEQRTSTIWNSAADTEVTPATILG